MVRSLSKHGDIVEDCEETMKVGFDFANRVLFLLRCPRCEAAAVSAPDGENHHLAKGLRFAVASFVPFHSLL
jgi:hypothetical protein